MTIPFDTDLPIFVWTILKVFFGRKKRALENQRGIPVNLQTEEVEENELSQAQRDYIRPFDEQLGTLNYRPLCNTRVTNFRNYGHNLARYYHNPADSAACALTIVEVKGRAGEIEVVKTSSHVSFTTRLSDGVVLTTRNMSLKSLMDPPPWRITQDNRQLTNLQELKRRHDARAATMGIAIPPPSTIEGISELKRDEHRRFSEFQLQRGVYRLLPDGEAYETTDKAHVRGIWNYHNPFAKRISWTEAILSALIGSVLPLFAILQVAPQFETRLGFPAFPATLTIGQLPVLAAYLLAGLLIGAFSQRATFLWIMLISYLPTHLIAGWSFGWLPYSTLAFILAGRIIRAKHRRAVIFEPRGS